MRAFLVLAPALLYLVSSPGGQGTYYETITDLHEKLLGNASRYNHKVRPSKKVTVYFALMLKSLSDMNIETESMAMKHFVILSWYDPRFMWEPRDYDNEYGVNFASNKVWTPPLYVDNKVTAEGQVESNIDVQAQYDGMMTWGAEISTVTECDVSTKYYPFDSQTCTVKFGLYAITDEMELQRSPLGDFDGFFSDNGEWDIVSRTTSRMDVVWEKYNQTYPVLGYTFQLKRRKTYYMTAIIIPVLLLSVLIVAVFWVPVESGEKMGYCLTILLTYTLFLSIVSDELPPIATDVSYLQVYLAVSMGMGVLATLLTIFVQRLYYRGDERVPDWLKSLTNGCLLPVTCQKRSSCCKAKDDFAPGDLKMNDVAVYNTNSTRAPVQDEVEEKEVTYQEVAVALDYLFLLVFTIVMVVVTIVFAVLMLWPEL